MKINIELTALLVPMFLIMFALKIAGATSMSWWMVTAPIWGPTLIFILIFILIITLKD